MQHGKLERLAKALNALGHPIKLRLFMYVLEHGEDEEHPVVPTMVATELILPVARVAHHLKRMNEAGILDRRVTGRYTFYRVNDTFLKQVKEIFP